MTRAAKQTLLRGAPEAAAEHVSEVLLGEVLQPLERAGEWVKVQCALDGYQGWLPAAALTEAPEGAFSSITALRGHIYAAPDVAAPLLDRLSLGSQVLLSGRKLSSDGRHWLELAWPAGGWISGNLLRPLPPLPALAREFMGTPYVWGGRSAWGIDCSGLVQTVLGAYGIALPRDASEQLAALTPTQPQAGALAFFKGHVGLLLSEREMLHATSYHMGVAVDQLFEGELGGLLQRDLLGYGLPTGEKYADF